MSNPGWKDTSVQHFALAIWTQLIIADFRRKLYDELKKKLANDTLDGQLRGGGVGRNFLPWKFCSNVSDPYYPVK